MAVSEIKLKEFLEKIAEENGYAEANVEVKAITSGGGNYTSNLYLANIKAPPKEDLKVFAKVANICEASRSVDSFYNVIYNAERVFYEQLAVNFKRLYDESSVNEKDRLYIPKFYGFNSSELEETLVLENLVAKGFGSFDRLKTFDWDYASKAVEELAKFHALGLAYRNEDVDKFEGMIRNLGMNLCDENFKEMLTKQANKLGAKVKEEFRGKLQKYLQGDLLSDMENLWKKRLTGFLLHGDFRLSNIMHRTQNGDLEVIVVDYQIYRLGCLVTDLMYFIWLGSNERFRKDHYQQLLEHYYTNLSKALRDLHVNADEVYSRNVFEQELEHTKTFGLFLGLTLLPLVTVDPEDAPDLEDREKVMVAPNQLALVRLNGIIEDFIRWELI